VLENFDRVHDFFEYAQSQGIPLSADMAVAKFKEVEKHLEYGYYGGDVPAITREVLGSGDERNSAA
jgi:hypothetical protein